MAHLVVLGFDDRRVAEEVFELGASLQEEALLDLEDSALAWRDEQGRVRIQQSLNTTSYGAASGATSGALWGALLGLIVLNPLAGMVVGGVAGGAAGALGGALADIGVDDDFIREVGGQLQPGSAAVFALVRRSTPDKVAEALKPYRPTVLHTNLTKDQHADLLRALQS